MTTTSILSDTPPAALAEVEHRGHAVQFYEDDAILTATVGHFVGAGLLSREGVIVIATREHLDGIRQSLEAACVDVDRACREGRLHLADAEATLGLFMVGDEPDGASFERCVGALVSTAAASSPRGAAVRAYGEMVDVLWKRGKRDAALRLEQMWNELARHRSFSLLCAYGVRGVEDAADRHRICELHTHVYGDDQERAHALETEIARRVSLERALREALATTKQKEEELRDFLENGLEGIHWVGPDGKILFANQAEMDLLGYMRDEYIGRHIREFHADQDVISDILQRLCANETLHDYEARLRCKDGSVKHVLIHSNVYWKDGKFIHTRCFTRDITARKRAEEKLTAIARELETASRAKDEFLATVSHELRTPLNAILGWIRMLRSGTLPADKHDRALDTIERNATAQTQLIEDLLDVSRIISGKLRLDVTTVDVPSVVVNAVEAVRPAAHAKSIRVRETVDPSAGPILGDAQRLQQVVWNLVTNAVKFTPKGGSVHVAVKKRESSVDIVVADDGEGIEPEFLPYVFERFRQADGTAARRYGGLGLGLAIVRHLVELHGGTVKVESEGRGRGATFVVSVPISPLRKASFERAPALHFSALSELQCPRELEGVRVVVVDDEPDARELLVEMLTACKAHVVAAASVAEAIPLVRQVLPDVLVSDIGMPVADGYELIRQLRELPASQGGRTPAVALTAYARFEDRTRALVAGFNMHVPKPVEPTELLAVLASLTAMFGPARKL